MERFVSHLLGELGAPLSSWASRASLERALRRRVQDARAACTDEERAERFARACPVPGATAADYLGRQVELSNGGRALLGARFKGGDTGLPFVELVACDRDVDWRELAARAAESSFRPRWLRGVVAAGRALPPGARPDLHIVAGPLDRAPARSLPTGVAFERRRDLDFLPAYDAEYARFLAGAGALAREVPPTSRDGFASCLTDGAIVCVRADGAWAGVAAASRGSIWVVDGFEVQEELLASHLRGRGLGPLLQRALMAELAPEALLVGTIHDLNAPSLATARRCGREVVGTFFFLDLPR